MSNEHMSLDAAATERKARLAKLASLKRKRPGAEITVAQEGIAEPATEDQETNANPYISGRNFDINAKGPKLGFEEQPNAQQETVEGEANRLAALAAEEAAKDEAEAEKGIDLFKLQPKKPNWDLKRDLAERMKVVDVRTQNAIARLVRERIQKSKQDAQRKGATTRDEGEELGVEGNTLVGAVHMREKEDEDERRNQASDEEDAIP